MNLDRRHRLPARPARQRASVLIIVLWVCFGLVSITLYFAQSMSFELRAADNQVAGVEAEQAIEGAARYLTNILAQQETPGALPDPLTYPLSGARVGASAFWLLGRGRVGLANATDRTVYGLIDESAKLNINTATREMLEALPGMTTALAAAIVDWRDTDSDVTESGAEDEIYQRLNPSYRCKNAPFESIEELRLVYGATLDLIYGEDTNQNGMLDPNENDGDLSPPLDNRDGQLDAGLLEYLTIFSRQSNTGADGTARVNVGNPGAPAVGTLLTETFGEDRAREIQRRLDQGNGNTVRSVIEFLVRAGLTAEESAEIEDKVTVTAEAYAEGLINVNTASVEVLTCVPGIGEENAQTLVDRRQSNLETETSMFWVSEILEGQALAQAGPYLTGHAYQVAADIAAVGHYGRGYRRVKFVFDSSEGSPKIVYRRDLTHLGWAAGLEARQQSALAMAMP